MNSLVLFKGKWSSISPELFGEIALELPHYNYISDTLFATNIIFTTGTGESTTFPAQGYVKEGKYLLSTKLESLTQAFLFYLEYNNISGTLEGYYTCVLPTDQGHLVLECTITCQGCLEDQPNQLAHGGFGGCTENWYLHS